MAKEYLQGDLRVFVVPTDILKVEELTIYEKMVYMVLRSFCNAHDATAFPSYPTIAKLGSMSERQAIRVVQSLIDKGLIKKEKRLDVTKNKKIRNTSNLYTVKTPRGVTHSHGVGDSQSLRGVTHSHGVGDSQSPENNHLKEPRRKKQINMDGRLGKQASPASQSYLDHDHIEYEWTLFRDVCQQYSLNKTEILDLWKTKNNYYPTVPITTAISVLREMMNDKVDFTGKEKEYRNLVGLFHHRMKSWKALQVALEDIEQ